MVYGFSYQGEGKAADEQQVLHVGRQVAGPALRSLCSSRQVQRGMLATAKFQSPVSAQQSITSEGSIAADRDRTELPAPRQPNCSAEEHAAQTFLSATTMAAEPKQGSL